MATTAATATARQQLGWLASREEREHNLNKRHAANMEDMMYVEVARSIHSDTTALMTWFAAVHYCTLEVIGMWDTLNQVMHEVGIRVSSTAKEVPS